MNDRIRELAEQAGLLKVADASLMKKYMPKEIKFAELIVQRCIDVAEVAQGQNLLVAEIIERHFGVEL